MRQGQQNRRGRNRSGRKPQNALSRNYESNGPNVKIRGTASHIADKYLALARDALSTGDVIVAESYFQHAEHYNRIIMAAQTDKQNGPERNAPSTGNGRDHDDDADMESEDDEPAQAGGNAAQEAAPSDSAQNKRRRRKPGNGSGNGRSKAETTGEDGQRAGRSAQARRGRSSAEAGRSRQKAASANGVSTSTDDGAPEGYST